MKPATLNQSSLARLFSPAVSPGIVCCQIFFTKYARFCMYLVKYVYNQLNMNVKKMGFCGN